MNLLISLIFIVLVIIFWNQLSKAKFKLSELETAMEELKQSVAGLTSDQGYRNAHQAEKAAVEAVETPLSPPTVSSVKPLTGIKIMMEPRTTTPPETADSQPANVHADGKPSHAESARTAPPEPRGRRERSRPETFNAKVDSEYAAVLKNFFFGDHLLVKIGVVILFFGMAFLVKYAAEHGFLPPEIRLILAAATGIVLIILGWLLRLKRTAYGQILQGGGIGIVYLTVFTAFRLYLFIPSEMAFILLIVVTVCSGTMAVLQDSRALAVLGIVGGFMAPILVSTGRGNHIILFSYYALLNAGICAIAWFKTWRELNVLGFIFTFGLGTLWGARHYHADLFVSTEPFLILYFLMFVFIAVLFSLRQPPHLKGYIDGTLVFGTPVLAFALQSFLVEPFPDGLAWSAVAAGSFYILLARLTFWKKRDSLRLLTEAFLAFGVIFITLAIPLAFTERWTSAVWALEGTGILWTGIRQHRLTSRLFGIGLQVLSWLFYLAGMQETSGAIAVFNGIFLGGFLISTAAMASAYFYNRCDDLPANSLESVFGAIFFFIGCLIWFANSIHEVHVHTAPIHFLNASLIFVALSCGSMIFLKHLIPWQTLLYPSLLLLPAIILRLLLGVWDGMAHPFEHMGYVAWVISFAVHYIILFRQHQQESAFYMKAYHGISYVLLTILCTWEVYWTVEQMAGAGSIWSKVMWGLIPAAFLLALSTKSVRALWPVHTNRRPYTLYTAAVVVSYLAYWIFFSGFAYTGDPAPLPYMPVFNPLDCTIAAVLTAILFWYRKVDENDRPFIAQKESVLLGLLAILGFFWLNTILLRTIHFWASVDYNLETMFRSVLVQTTLSIFWTLCALCAMVWASRRMIFEVWIAGGGLLGIVVLKLFIIDLSKSNTVERIISFVVVGFLLLLVGYFSPLPPKRKDR